MGLPYWAAKSTATYSNPTTYNYQLSLTNLRDALHHGKGAAKVDAQCDTPATELS